MSAVQDLLKELDQGVPPSTVIARPEYNWNHLSVLERDELCQAAETQGAQRPEIIAVLGHLAWKSHDPWGEIKAGVLKLVFTQLTSEQQKKNLQYLDGRFEALRQNLVDGDVQRYFRYLADYRMVRAGLLETEGQPNDAANLFEAAAQNYRQCDYQLGQLKASQSAATLRGLIERQVVLLPLELLKTEHFDLLAEVDRLKSESDQLRAQNQELSKIGDHLKLSQTSLQAQKDDLTNQLQNLEAQQQGLKHEFEASRTQIDLAGQWLKALSQTIMAPVWVAAARAALWRGEIDLPSVHALRRLVQAYPDDAMPLLIEIVARAPEALKDGVPEVLMEFQSNLQRARISQSDDPVMAAEALVSAWELALSIGDGSHDAG